MNRYPVVLLLLASSGACKKSVDTADFESRIKTRTEELGITGATVSCPKGIEAKTGASFECAITAGGKTYTLATTITGVEGKQLSMDTKWKDGEAVLPAKLAPALGEELSKQFGTPVTTDCGKDVLVFVDKSRNVTCELSAGETKSKVLVTFDDKLNPTTWKLDPQLLAKDKLEGILIAPVREKLSPTLELTCGNAALLPRPADGVVWCEIAEGDKKQKLKVDVDENLKVTHWETAP